MASRTQLSSTSRTMETRNKATFHERGQKIEENKRRKNTNTSHIHGMGGESRGAFQDVNGQKSTRRSEHLDEV